MKKYCIDCREECTSTRCWDCYNKHRRETKVWSKRSVILTCTWCEIEFQRGRSGVTTNNFCGRPCYLAWRSANPKAQYKHSNKLPRQDIQCTFCNTTITKKTKDIGENNFCNQKCHNNWQKQQRADRLKYEHEHPKYCKRCGTKINQGSTYCRPCVTYINTPKNSIGDNPKWWENWRRIIKETRSRGENHYNWHGGASSYGQGFDTALRELVRQRDNHQCQLCPKSQVDNGEDLSVHHKDYDKHNNHPSNLVSLCRRCHTKTNHNREYWKAHFQDKQKEETIFRTGLLF